VIAVPQQVSDQRATYVYSNGNQRVVALNANANNQGVDNFYLGSGEQGDPGFRFGARLVPVARKLSWVDDSGDPARKGLEDLGPDPRSVLRALGVTHFLRVVRRVSEGEPELLDKLVAGRKPVWVIDPASGPAGTREAFLPTEMDFPLHALWSVNRPGPILELYALD